MASVTASKRGLSGDFLVLVHGGAGDVAAANRERHVAGCRHAARAAASALDAGASALDAAVIAVKVLEDDPSFNAGTGACLNAAGDVEHDASIMEGVSLRAGSVCALSGFANPIAIARAALEDGKHVLYAAAGARDFARANGFVPAPAGALITEAALRALEATKRGAAPAGWAGGTVGAVVRDRAGITAAATSTGGTTNKHVGRVGDTPIIGAGTYADELSATSTTGHGEAMIRIVAAKQVADAIRAGAHPEGAALTTVELIARRLESTCGIITLSADGRWGWARSTATMSWAAASNGFEEAGI
jgi:beta-aspartyl-peptidase (threonine type)